MAVTTGSERRQSAVLRAEPRRWSSTSRRARMRARCWCSLVVALLNILPGFFTIPPIDRDEARFAQATKQMIETGDYVDIRFQDEVRYKKPVGIYWLQAGAVKAGQALGVRAGAHHDLALSHSVAARRARRGAAHLLGGARLRVAPRRRARRPDDGDLPAAQRRGTDRQDRRHAARHRRRRHGRAGARSICRSSARSIDARRHPGLLPAIFWTALAAGVLLKGPVILMVVGACGGRAGRSSTARRAGCWRCGRSSGIVWFALAGAALVPRHHRARRRELLCRVDRPRPARQDGQRAGIPRRAARLLSAAVLGRRSGRARCWPALAAPAIWAARREPGAKFLLAWLVPSWIVFELVIDQAAALRAAALSGDRDPASPGIVDARMLSHRRWLATRTIWWFLLPLLGGHRRHRRTARRSAGSSASWSGR